jgi:hypothetical protein
MNYVRILIPVGLGLAAAFLNFYLVWSMVAPVELVVAKEDIKAGNELNAEMLDKVSVHADPKLFRSVVPYAERGAALLQLRAKRELSRGEVILFDDVWRKGARPELRPGEKALTVSVRRNRTPSNLRVNDWIEFRVYDELPRSGPLLDGRDKGPSPKSIPPFGPFRVVGLDDDESLETQSARSTERVRKITVAIPADDLVTPPQVQAKSIDTGERLVNVEFSRPPDK